MGRSRRAPGLPKGIEKCSHGGLTTAALAAAKARIAELETEIARLSARDSLVASLLTLPALRAQLELDVQRAHRYSRPLAVAILDIDHFRRLNVARGYAAGDLVLAAVGRLLAAGTRAHDLVAAPGATSSSSCFPKPSSTRRCGCSSGSSSTWSSWRRRTRSGSQVSGGLAALRSGENADDVLARAQHALAVARDEGGGRIQVSKLIAREAPAEDAGVSANDRGGGGARAGARGARQLHRASTRNPSSTSWRTSPTRWASTPHEITTIRSAALLHNFGKIGISDEILNKAGPLDEEEWEIMREHPVIGERILRAIPGMGAVARIVRHEHERWDGTGYPDGLAGDAIPVGARIILACDAYQAMTSNRPYRGALSHHMAVAELTANAGSQFDPKVVEALVGYLVDRRESGVTTA